jgi:hypothetical protein
MDTNEVRRVWVVVFAHSGIPVKVGVFGQYAEAARCHDGWETTIQEEYDAVALFESPVT